MATSYKSITAPELKSLIQSGSRIDLIDVRTPVEFQEIHVEIARNQPLDRLDPKAIQAARDGTSHESLYVICRSGSRGGQACEKFIAAGFDNVINVVGGTMACTETGIPVIRGRKAMSLERQVRIAAGGMVFMGAALGFFVHTYWIGLSAFAGAGLVFAGVTDTCGMGMMLAKMPWNQVKVSSSASSDATCSTKTSAGCCK